MKVKETVTCEEMGYVYNLTIPSQEALEYAKDLKAKTARFSWVGCFSYNGWYEGKNIAFAMFSRDREKGWFINMYKTEPKLKMIATYLSDSPRHGETARKFFSVAVKDGLIELPS